MRTRNGAAMGHQPSRQSKNSMFESHFGFTGPPFQLSPDPSFYFDSRGHNHALAYLKFGVYQAEGFIVVTGEIGAGKTTLVRTLIDGLQSDEVVAAQIVSTQLDSGDLLRSIVIAFGIPSQGIGKADLVAAIEAFLTSLASARKRALLVVDEAQNLPAGAIEELRMLSNFQLGNRALLQSFLVGQPELRQFLQSGAMEQFRQRVIASCHLGPLEASETRAYVEHRLRRVGWTNNPSFDELAFERIHFHARGVPRRINLLCTRLLLGACLTDETSIHAAQVDNIADEFSRELGGVAPAAAATQPAAPSEALLLAPEDVQGPGQLADVVRRRHGEATTMHRPLVCLVDTPLGYLKALALAQGLREHTGLPDLVIVNPGQEAAVTLSTALSAAMSRPSLELHLGATSGRFAQTAAVAQTRFDAVLTELAPCAALSLGHGDALFACSLVAVKAELPLLRLEADEHADEASGVNGTLLDQLAQVLYVGNILSHYTLHRRGATRDRICGVGRLLENVVHLLMPSAVPAAQILSEHGVALESVIDSGYALVTEQFEAHLRTEEQFAIHVDALCAISAVLPLVWVVQQPTFLALSKRALRERLDRARVILVPQVPFLQLLGLLASARAAVLGPDLTWAAEAQAVGLPSMCLALSGLGVAGAEIGSSSRTVRQAAQAVQEFESLIERDRSEDGSYWDGGAAHKIAAHLRGWLRRHASAHGVDRAARPEMVLP